MEHVRYRGATLDPEQIAELRTFVTEHAHLSRRALSLRLCAKWGWVQPNGTPRDMVARGLLLALDRAGHLTLPPARVVYDPSIVRRKRPARVECDETPIEMPLASLGPFEIAQVRRTAEEKLVNSLIEQYHYLGYVQPVGEHLKFLVRAKGREIACLTFSSAPRHLGARDRFIGWNKEARTRNIRFIAYNPRYLILPWVRVPHLASHLLGVITRRLSEEWECVYGHPVYFVETFVDISLYRGTCYRAANWIPMGLTTGRGKNDQTMKPNRSLKEVLGLALHRKFREFLTQ